MTWLAWRQLRANAVFAVAAIALITVVLVATRSHIASAVASDDLSTFDDMLQLLGTALIGVPVFIGAFWGAPLVARELEAGTHRLAWTQSVSRGRWLATRLAAAGVLAILVTGAFSAVFTWWSTPFDEIGNRIGTANFGQRGIAPVAYAVFALALGALAGAVIRRTLPAMAASAAAFFVVRFVFQLAVRPHLVHVDRVALPANIFGQRADASGSGWILSTTTVDGTGRTIPGSDVTNVLAHACHLTRESAEREFVRCADRLGVHDVMRMHPDSQFWAMQTWESISFVVLAAGVVALCYWWVARRTA
jgi:ABC-type transport system involved in multi-copper enzyme maturation permease subunit